MPIIHTGCDTYASIYPEFKHFNKLAGVDAVVEHLLSLTPNGKWVQDNGQDVHLIMTGGEPLLAWQKLYIDLFEHPRMQDLRNVTFETNTTQHLHNDFFNYLNDQDRIQVTWSCSPKLSVSGEPWDTAIKPDVAEQYNTVTDSDNKLKIDVAISNSIILLSHIRFNSSFPRFSANTKFWGTTPSDLDSVLIVKIVEEIVV